MKKEKSKLRRDIEWAAIFIAVVGAVIYLSTALAEYIYLSK